MHRPYSTIREAGKARISLFNGARGREPQSSIGYDSIADLTRHFRKKVQVVERKDEAPLYTRGLAIGGREREDVLGPYLVVLDIDHSGMPVKECSQRLQDLGVAHLAHTTWSHDPDSVLDEHSYRVVVDLVAEDWQTVRGLTRELAGLLEVELDPVSEHQLCFFVPSIDGSRKVEFASWGGPSTWEPDPSTWDDTGPPPAAERPQVGPVDLDDVDMDEVREALATIPNEERGQWIRTGQCLHGSGLENARDLWDSWSAGQDYGAFSPEEQARVWESFKKAGLGLASIYYDAKNKYGWKPPRPPSTTAAEDFEVWQDEEETEESKVAAIERLSERYAYVALGQGAIWDKVQGRFMTKNAFMGLYLHPEFFTGQFRADEPVMESLAHCWWEWEERPTYAGVEFAPPGAPELPRDILNRWEGWGCEPAQGSQEDLRAGCALFLDHVHEVLCQGDEGLYAWILAWLGHLVQRPAEKPGTCIVMRGEEGTGKGFFGETLCALVGKAAEIVGDSGGLTKNFNARMSGKLLVFGDEVTWGGRRADAGVLKGLITGPTITIEPKGIDSYTERSYARTLISSNEGWVVPAGTKARRFLMLDVSEAHREDRPYFAAIQAQLDDGGLEALHGYLAGLDPRKLPDPRRVVRTAALLDQKVRGLDAIDSWLFEALQSGEISPYCAWEEDNFRVSTSEIYAQVIPTADRRNERVSPRLVTQRVDKVLALKTSDKVRIEVEGDPGENPRRARARMLPGLAEARESFERYVGQPVDWEDEEDG